MGLKICLDKNLDGLVAGVDFDADRCIAEIDFVSATNLSPDDRVRHLRPAPCDSADAARSMIAAPKLKIIVRLNEPHSPCGDVHRRRIPEALREPQARIPP